MAKRHLALVAVAAGIGLNPIAGSATPYILDYTGVVDVVYSYTGALPSGVAVGTTIHGQITFDASLAEAPSYTFTSCSGSCGGDAITARFRAADQFHLSLVAGDESFSADQGAIDLDDDYVIPGQHRQAILFDDGYASPYDYSLAIAFNRIVDGTSTLFPDVNVLDGLQFGNVTTASGWAFNDDWYISFKIDLPQSGEFDAAAITAPPLTLLIFGAALAGFGFRRRRS